jgi:hypothetical protein
LIVRQAAGALAMPHRKSIPQKTDMPKSSGAVLIFFMEKHLSI